ncbi:MAG: hypothetical protein L0387_21305, partial [Acidobacteria bacterium]|nr:hypothetical protein [Acidobacteriota bacterium]
VVPPRQCPPTDAVGCGKQLPQMYIPGSRLWGHLGDEIADRRDKDQQAIDNNSAHYRLLAGQMRDRRLRRFGWLASWRAAILIEYELLPRFYLKAVCGFPLDRLDLSLPGCRRHIGA